MHFRIIQPSLMNPAPPMNYVTDRYSILQQKVVDKLGGKVLFDDNPPLDNADLVLGYNLHFEPALSERVIKSLPKKTILIIHWNDLHAIGNRKRPQMEALMHRADVILAPYKYAFRLMWPGFLNKFIWLPHFIAPTDRYSKIEYNNNPMHKCLITGAAEHEYYPMRRLLVDNMNTDCVRLQHPGYRTGRRPDAIIGDTYAVELNKYLCSVATCSVLNYSLGKYYEIPAAGSLLLAQWTPDLDDIGLVDGVNCVRIDAETVFDIIHDICTYPDKYEHIRKEGHRFALANFGVEHRVETVCNVIKNLLGETYDFRRPFTA